MFRVILHVKKMERSVMLLLSSNLFSCISYNGNILNHNVTNNKPYYLPQAQDTGNSRKLFAYQSATPVSEFPPN